MGKSQVRPDTRVSIKDLLNDIDNVPRCKVAQALECFRRFDHILGCLQA